MSKADLNHLQRLAAIKYWVIVGALLCIFSVLIGAFAAHGLKTILTHYQLAIIDTGAQYQMYHGLAVIVASTVLLALHSSPNKIRLVNGAFAVGITLFSGSLYCLAVFDIKMFAYFTPIGGLSLIVAWCLFIWTIYTSPIKLKSNN